MRSLSKLTLCERVRWHVWGRESKLGARRRRRRGELQLVQQGQKLGDKRGEAIPGNQHHIVILEIMSLCWLSLLLRSQNSLGHRRLERIRQGLVLKC